MRNDQKENKKEKAEKKKPYEKPALTMEELFEATVLGCSKIELGPCGMSGPLQMT